MTLPASGIITMDQVRTELGLSGVVDLDSTVVRNLAGIPSGQIDMHSLHGKSRPGWVTLLAGSFIYDSSQTVQNQDGQGTAAILGMVSYPDMTVDTSGNIYFTDMSAWNSGANVDNQLRKCSLGGAITTLWSSTFNGSSARGVACDGTDVYFACGDLLKRASSGAVTVISSQATWGFGALSGVVVQGSYVYATDYDRHVIWRIDKINGNAVIYAGQADNALEADGQDLDAAFWSPYCIIPDGSGGFFVSDAFGDTIRRISASGYVSTFAGMAGSDGFLNATGTSAMFKRPRGMTMDGFGNIFVAESRNNNIRKVTPGAVVTSLMGNGMISTDYAQEFPPVGFDSNGGDLAYNVVAPPVLAPNYSKLSEPYALAYYNGILYVRGCNYIATVVQ